MAWRELKFSLDGVIEEGWDASSWLRFFEIESYMLNWDLSFVPIWITSILVTSILTSIKSECFIAIIISFT